MSAWRDAITIVVLRYLYFGLLEQDVDPHFSRPSTPTPAASSSVQFSPHAATEDFYSGEEDKSYFSPEHLSPDTYLNDPFPRSPTPVPTPRPDESSMTFDHWRRRYDIHNEAAAELFNSLSVLWAYEDVSYLRYTLLPIIVLALISPPSSEQRTLCLVLFERFKAFMSQQDAQTDHIGGSKLDFDIPWEKLDAYSAEMEQQRRADAVVVERHLQNSAPEWNWWYMLKEINLQTVCES